MDGLFPESAVDTGPAGPRRIADGAVHLPGWLAPDRQRHLVEQSRHWAAGPVPPHSTVLPGGHRMSVRTIGLGWHWLPGRYSRRAEDVNGARVPPVPAWLVHWGREAVSAVLGPTAGERYHPDVAVVNHYPPGARMGMHQDRDEQVDAPIVSLSVGDTCRFRFGNPHHRGRPHHDLRLRSGDLFVFGGASRFAFHGVPEVFDGTADPACGLTRGRLNVTLRQTGLS